VGGWVRFSREVAGYGRIWQDGVGFGILRLRLVLQVLRIIWPRLIVPIRVVVFCVLVLWLIVRIGVVLRLRLVGGWGGFWQEMAGDGGRSRAG
jgi:hypothetical protein